MRAKIRDDDDEPIAGRSDIHKSPTSSVEKTSPRARENLEKTEFVIKGAENSDSELNKEEELEEFIQVL